MSVFDSLSQTPAQAAASELKQDALATFNALVSAYTIGAMKFWSNPDATPAEIAEALGTQAGELFALHAKIGRLIAEVRPSSVEAGTSLVGQFEMNADGSVTILSGQAG